MSSTSRILRDDELSQVNSVWLRSTDAPVLAVRKTAALAPTAPNDGSEQDDGAKNYAYQKGFSEGRTVGRDQAAAELQPVLDRLSRTLAELSTLKAKIRKDAEGDLLKLSIGIARRVLHRELTLDPESIEGLIRVAMEKLESRELSRVRVHPDQELTIRNLLSRFGGPAKVDLTPDPALQLGDVLFETPHGTLDASIEAQLQEIDRGFADRLRS
ncbi:MAG: FliH/SctL family protein [Bryobacteraceae bacterium]